MTAEPPGIRLRTQPQPEPHGATAPRAIDHLALRLNDPDAMAGFLCDGLGMRVLERGDQLRLGADAEHAKVILHAAEGPREAGALRRVVLRVGDLDGALAKLPKDVDVRRPLPELAVLEGPEGLGLGLTEVLGGGADYDIDHLILRVMDPEETTVALAELGFVPRGGALHVADKHLRLEAGPAADPERSLLDHIGIVVESVEGARTQARQAGLELAEAVEAADAFTLVVRGPERIRLTYLERRGA